MKEKKIEIEKGKFFQLTLRKDDSWFGDGVVLKTAILKPPFLIEAKDKFGIQIRELQIEVLPIIFTFESEDARDRDLNYITGVISNPDCWTFSSEVFSLDMSWDDDEKRSEREALMKERKELWENCDCVSDEGCEKCAKQKKFEGLR
jgi:hypothetical protein